MDPQRCGRPPAVCWQHPVPAAQAAVVRMRLAGSPHSLTAELSRGESWQRGYSDAARGAAAEPHCVQASFPECVPAPTAAAAAAGSSTDVHRQKGTGRRGGRGEGWGSEGRDSGWCPDRKPHPSLCSEGRRVSLVNPSLPPGGCFTKLVLSPWDGLHATHRLQEMSTQ